MRKTTKFLMLLASVVLTACTDNNDNPSGNPQPTPVDAGPSYTDKTVDVNRDGKAYGQVSLRFYSNMPSVAYISVADFHKIMTAGETMTVTRQGDLYGLQRYGNGRCQGRLPELHDLRWLRGPDVDD